MIAPTKPNAELAYAVLDHIDANPKQWNQAEWWIQTDCGTAACFAGWAVALAGHKVASRETYGYDAIDGDENTFISTVAARDLGLTEECTCTEGCGRQVADDNAARLFYGSNTRKDLGGLVAEIFGPRPEDKPDHSPDACRVLEGQRCPRCAGLFDEVPPNAGSAS